MAWREEVLQRKPQEQPSPGRKLRVKLMGFAAKLPISLGGGCTEPDRTPLQVSGQGGRVYSVHRAFGLGLDQVSLWACLGVTVPCR